MNVVDAAWEKRNIGVSCLEIDLLASDSISDLEEYLIDKDVDYVVLKCPVNCSDFIWNLPRAGFTFIESQIILELSKDNYRGPSFIKITERNTDMKRLFDKAEILRAIEKIPHDVFDTDRISLDPHFSKELAGMRYKNWVLDLMDKGDHFLELSVKGVPAGFFIARKSEGPIGYAGLAGMYSQFKGKGFGISLINKGMNYILQAGHQKIITGVSSNNKNILKVHNILGFEVCDIKYVYVKHKQKGELL